MDEHALEQAGLTRNEARVYLALLRAGKATAGSLAGKVGLHRRTIYDCVRRLEGKGLIGSVIEGKKSFLKAHEPQKLLDHLHEEEEQLHHTMSGVQAVLPFLNEMTQQGATTPEVMLFKGKEGIKSLLEGIIRSGVKEWLSFMSAGYGSTVLTQFLPHFHQRRIAKGIKLSILAVKEGASWQRAQELAKMKRTTVRILPRMHIIPISIWVYSTRVVFTLWEAQVGILVDDKSTADSFRKYFDVLWKVAKPMKK